MVEVTEFVAEEAGLGPACQVWNAAVATQSELYLPMTPALMAERLAGRIGIPADICLLAEDGSGPVGLAIATTTPLADARVANLACVAVVPGRQGEGIATRLLSEVERRSRAAGREALRVDYSATVRLAHGVDPRTPGHRWLLHRGFRVFRDQLFMRLDLAAWQMPDEIKRLTASLGSAGVSVRLAERDDLPALLECVSEFGESIARTLRGNAAAGEPEPVLIAAEGGRTQGFVGPLTVSPCGFADFDLIGVTAPARGRGLGKALLYHCLEHFRQRGARQFELMTAPTNPAQKLYLDAGMRLVTVLVCHEKAL